MKILEIHIYGFGQLNNIKISELNDFQVFYGENEAGKSTIMAFIHGILFGFPTKQQSAELRYEPKHDSNYGGILKIAHEKLGKAVIERVKGKASGDVSVTLEDGTVGGEELLKQLLSNMDKGLYKAIFSFNLQGLQNIHQMRGEEIGKFLFSAGTLGTERLAKTELELQRELEARFKPTGKKPYMNEKLKEIHELKSDLKKAAANNQQYELLVTEKESLQQEMEQTNHLLQEVQNKVEKLKEWKKIHLLVKEERWIKNEISQIGEFHFPARGIERFEQLNQLIYPFNAQISSLVERMKLLKKELSVLQPDQNFLDHESDVLTALDQVPLYEQLKLEKQRYETKLVELEEKISIIHEKLHLPITEEEVLSINTNIYMKNRVEVVTNKHQRLLEEKEELEEKFREERNALVDLEEKVHNTESQLLSTEERARLEKIINEAGDKNTVEIELKAVQDKIEFYRHAHEEDERNFANQKKQNQIQFFTIELVFIVISLYGFFTKHWILLFLGVIGSVLIAVFISKMMKKKYTSDPNQLLAQLIDQEKSCIQKLELLANLDNSVLQKQLNSDNQRREHLQLVKMKFEQQNEVYEKVISKFEEWESKTAENREHLLKVSHELKIPEKIANSFLLEAFHLIEQYKIAAREKRQLLAALENIGDEQDMIVGKLTYYAIQYLGYNGNDLTKIAYQLRNKLNEENEKRIKSQEKLEKRLELEADMHQMEQELSILKTEQTKLLNEARVTKEEQFYESGNKFDKKQKLGERLADIRKQLQYTILKEEEWENFLQIHNDEELFRQYSEERKRLSAQIVQLQEKYASTKYEIQTLEEGGVYSELLHKFNLKKFELEEAAKEWSVYSLAQEILSRTVEKYKNVYLPRMLSKAEEYLFFLTDGNYRQIHLQKTGTGFLIERRDGTFFEANELSQATTEQVYVSIRLSLATTLYEKYRFPIMIDDSFVNFDAKRTEKVMELLKRLHQNQILFFTCHKHLLHHFHQENVLNLHNNAVKVIS